MIVDLFITFIVFGSIAAAAVLVLIPLDKMGFLDKFKKIFD